MQYYRLKIVNYQDRGGSKTIFGFLNITFTFAEN